MWKPQGKEIGNKEKFRGFFPGLQIINLYKVLFYLEFSRLIIVMETNSLKENQQITEQTSLEKLLKVTPPKKCYLKSAIGKKSMFDHVLKEDNPCTKHKPNDATASSTRWQK